MVLIWKTQGTHPCERCKARNLRVDGDGWSSKDPQWQGLPPLHEHCECEVYDVEPRDLLDQALHRAAAAPSDNRDVNIPARTWLQRHLSWLGQDRSSRRSK